ncbi:leucine--tRNA ligase [Candidatus Wolfebacteria bacterium]|nr:MAG: leucine--tRNA ligase [Candidatus Wolfebacteria bacterium]
MKKYDHKKIEKKWQKEWIDKGIYKTEDTSKKNSFYILDMFPYPSGSGLHVGHPKGYIATDVYSRMQRMKGFNVLHPMGWDAFGLPAEQFAIKNKVHPRIAVEKNVARYKEQLQMIGLDYDWSREVNTTDPEYYKWTQWTFLKMYEKGLAFESDEPINWCDDCKTGLAQEDLEDGACERCGNPVIKKPLRQWVLKITDYADRMLEDLEDLNWPEYIKESQRNWIGRSEGAEITFKIKDSDLSLDVFTTRPDTLFGATYMVVAPEHSMLTELKSSIENWSEIETYAKDSVNKTEIERTAEGKEKSGVQLIGIKAINPANNEEIPVWVADYVLPQYGTGAIMAVPAHDQRDFEFAQKYKIPIIMVVCTHYPAHSCPVLEEAYPGKGHLVFSGKFDGMESDKAKDKIIKFVNGKKKVNYKLRDWVFSRQRYWGEPIPLIHCEKCGVVPVPEKDLPVRLPDVENYEPTNTGESPLTSIDEWVNVSCPSCDGPGTRETNTMPQWAGSNWYYLRYIDPQNKDALIDSKKEKKFMPVDVYVGGVEHATRHLIYARFWHKFLYDIKVVSDKEPFMELHNQGLILAEDGRKMSKRWDNTVSPDDMIERFGADAFRTYEMFMGPFENAISWNTDGMVGTRRFIDKIWKLQDKIVEEENTSIDAILHTTIQKVEGDIQSFKFNTAISAMMILANTLEDAVSLSKKQFELFLRILAPFAPYVTEELWHEIGNKESIHVNEWPSYDTKKMKVDQVTVVLQVNGKVRSSIEVTAGRKESEIRELALSDEVIEKWIDGKEIKKFIYVKDKIVNVVV